MLKVVMTGSASDPIDWQQHIRNKPRREALANRFRDPKDPFKVVIVRDMWLTGFDAPSLHTMYVDKPMRGHGLMQAIARVNRVFKDKPGGLVVDYLGLAHELKAGSGDYTESGGHGTTAINQEEAVKPSCWRNTRSAAASSTASIGRYGSREHPKNALDYCRPLKNTFWHRKTAKIASFVQFETFPKRSRWLYRHEALRIRDDVAFFQAVRAVIAKRAPGQARTEEELEHAIRQIVSKAVASDEVIDIFAAAGLKKPDISILSDEFLAEMKGMPQRNLAVELLRKLLTGEIQTRRRKNVVQSRSFSEMLEQSIRRYQNRAIEAAQVIEELIALAKQMRQADQRGEELKLNEDELAFYDALETNDSAVKVMGDETLRTIARELVAAVRANITIDWTIRENVRAQLRVIVKRILRKFGYPPDKQEKATLTVLEQAEVLSEAWAAA